MKEIFRIMKAVVNDEETTLFFLVSHHKIFQ